MFKSTELSQKNCIILSLYQSSFYTGFYFIICLRLLIYHTQIKQHQQVLMLSHLIRVLSLILLGYFR